MSRGSSCHLSYNLRTAMCLEMVGIITKFWCSNTHHWAVEENHVRTSGRAGQLACQISRSRIIPACAENSTNEAPGSVGHPRACRASSTRASRPGKRNGSSPRLRRVIPQVDALWLIHACAWHPFIKTLWLRTSPEHPSVCRGPYRPARGLNHPHACVEN